MAACNVERIDQNRLETLNVPLRHDSSANAGGGNALPLSALLVLALCGHENDLMLLVVLGPFDADDVRTVLE